MNYAYFHSSLSTLHSKKACIGKVTPMNNMHVTERDETIMSYMSGMMMGLAFGQGVRRLLTGGAKKFAAPAFALVRAIPGRRRYYAKALKRRAGGRD